MKSVSLEEISESVVFHFCVLFIFPDMQTKFKKNILAVNMNVVEKKKKKKKET